MYVYLFILLMVNPSSSFIQIFVVFIVIVVKTAYEKTRNKTFVGKKTGKA